ncbi:SPOR domain-containing protein [Mariprofundus erugo]|uniref:SPOR domain-containing protein n=1 Tax=Mariprofundus erugo TaxID=2528639 RepID=A0A5R9GRF4_9PROT|nr:SPOR domain-containing protein [Mariprofundus erugo]TLS68168.1 SPOR domain-containing protein [Mariprofundus erugo]TLS75754.1 SPOR domain-containing protein [Mariprofundus erugo]
MAKQDFARLEAPSRKDKKQDGISVVSVVAIVLIAGLCFVAGYWIGGQQGGGAGEHGVPQAKLDALQAKLDEKAAENHVLQANIEGLQEQVELWKAKAQQSAHARVGNLQFYSELPKQSVKPSPVLEPAPEPEADAHVDTRPVAAARVEVKPVAVDAHPAAATRSEVKQALPAETAAVVAPAVDDALYRIQIASFRSREDANSMQQKLTQAGFRALVETVELGDKGTWYRIFAGPYGGRIEADKQLADIEQKVHVKGLLIRGG